MALNLSGAGSLGAGLDFVPGAAEGGGSIWGGLSGALGMASGLVGSPLVSAGASLLGGFLNRSSSSKVNLTELAFNQAQNEAARNFTNFWNERQMIDAKETRDWQERLANTAHQREMADYKAAGLNPVLSARGGGGAQSPQLVMPHLAGSPGHSGTTSLRPQRYDLGEAVSSAIAAKEKMLMMDQIQALTEKEKAGTGLLSEEAKTEVERRVNLRADTELKGIEGKERTARIEVIRAEEEKLWRENYLGERYGEERYLSETGQIKAGTKAAESSASLHSVTAALSNIELEMYKDNPNLKTVEKYVNVIKGAVGGVAAAAFGASAVSRSTGGGSRTSRPFVRR